MQEGINSLYFYKSKYCIALNDCGFQFLARYRNARHLAASFTPHLNLTAIVLHASKVRLKKN